MKTLKIVLCLLLMGLTLSACSAPKTNGKWDKTEMANIADPGFSIVSKTKTSAEIKYLFKDVEVTAANAFLTALYASEFNVDTNYNYDATFYSYAAYNSSGKSIDFEYNVTEKTASFTYGLGGSSVFVSGVRDMGYFVKVNIEKELDAEYKNYNVWLWYSVNLNVKLTNQTDTITTCAIKNVKVKSPPRLGSISISSNVYLEGTDDFTKTCASIGTWDMGFIVRQKGIGKYIASMAYSKTMKPYFDAMSVSQADLNFSLSFTVEIQTNKGSYSRAYDIPILPVGSDLTNMELTYEVKNTVTDISKGTPYTKK
jgi:hypothetical protein